MKENDARLVVEEMSGKHVLVDSDDVEAVRAESIDDGVDLGILHGDVASDLRVGVVAGEGGPGVKAHADVDESAIFVDVEVVAADGEFIDKAKSFAGTADNFVESGGIKRKNGRGRRRRDGSVSLADEVEGGLEGSSEFFSRVMAVDVEEEEARLLEEEMIVEGVDFEVVLLESGDHGIDFVLSEDEVAHEDIEAPFTFGESDPTGEAEGSGSGLAGDGDGKVVAWNADLENFVFEVAGAAENF